MTKKTKAKEAKVADGMVTITVALNGTSENPYYKMGLKQNPFPQTGHAEFDAAERRINSLGGEPIPSDRPREYIVETLQGFSQEFIDLCVQNYHQGKMVKFKVSFPEKR
jgi:hypothetical protein